jgi:hypothetical protein
MGRVGDNYEMPAAELEKVTGLARREVLEHLEILRRYGFAYLDEEWDRKIAYVVAPTPMQSGWPFWHDLRKVCTTAHRPVDLVVRDIEFDILDG